MRQTSVDKSITVEHLGESFVDDTSLGCSNQSPSNNDNLEATTRQQFQSTLPALTKLAQEWERLLYSTDGGLNLQKSFWFTMAWQWRNGIASLVTTNQCPGE
jgi:hypothetical protein